MLVGGNEVDARYYGIMSSTTKDLTARFQDMADDLSVASGARKIILPPGEFHIAGTINVRRSRPFVALPATINNYEVGFQLVGQGRYSSVIYQDLAGVPAIRIYTESTSTFRNQGYVLQGFGIQGQGLGNAGNVGIQLGGVSTDRTDVVNDIVIRDVMLRNFASPMRLDDVTSLYMEQMLLEHYLYGIEMGFNIDAILATQCSFGSGSIPKATNCTTTNGSTTVTTASTASIVAGMGIKGTGITAGTTVASVVDATTFTLSAAATASGTNSMNFSLGTTLSYGAGPWTPAASTPGQEQAHKFLSCWFMRNRRVAEVLHNGVATVEFDSCYSENCARFATLNSSTATSGTKQFAVVNHTFSLPGGFADYAIYEDGTSTVASVIKIERCDGGTGMTVPWLRTRTASTQIAWELNNLSSSTDLIHILDSTTAYSPGNGTQFNWNIGGTYSPALSLGVTGALTPKPIAKANSTLKVGPMTGNVTINDVATSIKNISVEGQRLRFVFVEDGVAGHTVTWNAAYHFHTAWTNSTLNTDANKRSYVEFEYTGSVWMQVSPANTWIA